MTERLLEGKTAIVTGGGSGLGRAICVLFRAHGARLAVADLNSAGAAETAAMLGEEHALALQVDVADEASVAAMVAGTLARFGGVDVLVNCAGIPQLVTPIEDLTVALWDRIMNVNAKSVFLCAKYTVPAMKKNGAGAIVSIASIVAERPKPGLNAYCASKAATIALSKSLALELAPFNIRVNAINPGAAETPMLGQFMDDPTGAQLEEGKKAFSKNIPLGRLVQPDDVAQAALYLASASSQIVTGVVLNVDGGRGV